MVCINLKFGMGHFRKKTIAHCQKQAENRLLILTHHLKGLSENQKINVIGSTNGTKVMVQRRFKDALCNTGSLVF